jgi:hypothetical protein
MFDINNSRDFYQKLVDEYEDLLKNPTSGRSAINCATTAYHMAEWVWGDWLKADAVTRQNLGSLIKIDDFKSWLGEASLFFDAMQAVANGSKHYVRKQFDQTQRIEGWVEAGYVEPGYAQEGMLLVNTSKGNDPNWGDFKTMAGHMVLFWKGFIEEYGPYSDLPLPPAEVAYFEQG